MITIFTHTKPFIEHFDIIQYNAIKSWRAISDDVEIIIYGDAEGSDNMAEEVNAKRVKSVPKSENGMPLLTYLFDHTKIIAQHDLLCYVNADIILPPNILNAINLIDRWSKKMIIGNRLDLDLRYKINYNDNKWWKKLFDYAIIEGEWHKKGGIDYFIFPKKLWKDMPDIYLGLPGSDNWLIWNARCRHIPVIDISNIVYAIHQNHDYSHLGDIDDSGYRIGSVEKGMKNYLSGLETAHNRQLLPKGVSMNINDATYYLSEKGPIRKKEAADIQRYLFSLIKIYPKTKFPILIIYSLFSYYIKIKKYFNNRFVLNG